MGSMEEEVAAVAIEGEALKLKKLNDRRLSTS